MRDLDVKMNWPILATLFRVIGKRVFLTFCLVSFLVVFLLAAVNVTSRRAMQLYVDDQVKRVPWDVSVYQTADVPQAGEVHDNVAKTRGVAQAERLYFLRAIPPYSVMPIIDGQQLRTPWLSILTATDPSRIMQLLPAPGVNAMLDRYVQGFEGFGVSVNARGVDRAVGGGRAAHVQRVARSEHPGSRGGRGARERTGDAGPCGAVLDGLLAGLARGGPGAAAGAVVVLAVAELRRAGVHVLVGVVAIRA